MGSRLRRWLFRQESTTDDVVGGLIAGLAIVLVFRFVWDDPWSFSLVSGVVVAILSALTTWFWRTRRTARRPE